MIFDMIVTRTDDGFVADVPNIKGCDSWAHLEDEVISKTVELVMFYLQITDKSKIKIDKTKGSQKVGHFKLVIDKEY